LWAVSRWDACGDKVNGIVLPIVYIDCLDARADGLSRDGQQNRTVEANR
jgi:hypothetical protein